MTTAEKLEHLWTYYKFALLIVVIVVVIVSFVVTGIINSRKEYLISGALINVSIEIEGLNYIDADYQDVLQGEDGKKEVQLNNFIFEDPAKTADFEMTSNAIYRLLAMVEGKMLDYIIADQVGLKVFLSNELFQDLRNILPEEELVRWQDYIINIKYGDDGDEIPVAINLKDTVYGKKYFRTEEDYYIAFVANTTRPEACLEFWNYLMALETAE
ncbi:MAG: hypothetical protein J6Q53_02675 [Oscillospiraceae bacterium]|nr:hypothetical protein [Oscillospiraceae bacterium]